MAVGALRLVMAGLWLVLAAGMVLGVGGLSDYVGGRNANLMALTAVVLAGWNAARWYTGRGRRPVPRAKAAGRKERPPAEYHPEFDFTKPE